MNWNRTLIVGLATALAYTSAQLWIARHEPTGEPLSNRDYEIEAAVARRAANWLESVSEDAHHRRFVHVAARLRPSVVSISVVPAHDEDDAEVTAPVAWRHRSHGDRTVSGTGILLDRQGHILTNLHVVEEARSIAVTLSSGERYAAQLIGTDRFTDLAVLDFESDEQLLPVEWVDPDELLDVGEPVLAIGNAYGLGWSVTQGIVSSLHRSGARERAGHYSDFIQTDAAINPGNSGGPLVNLAGRVIGINSVIVSEHGDSAGIGLALPAADARFVAQQLIRHGEVERGCLGLVVRALSTLGRARRADLGVGTVRGALVTSVRGKGPAARAGVRVGDVILELEGNTIPSFAALRSTIARSPVDQPVELTILRDGRQVRLEVRVGALEEYGPPRYQRPS